MKKDPKTMQKEYDFIIVGAGAAGCLLANRLSQNINNQVLLIEAGQKDFNPLIRIPMLAGLLYYLPSLNWGYSTELQRRLNDRALVWPRGKVLGGSTAINGMMYVRGQKEDYDHWFNTGLTGWSYNDLLPFFKTFEKNVSHAAAQEFHGVEGELHTETARATNPLYKAWLESALAAGHKSNHDFNGVSQEGVGPYDFNIKNGQRVSAANAFLKPIETRSNLKVLTKSQVSRLLFNNKECVGVQIGDKKTTYTARRETILACGSVNSPQILQLSGIGDAKKLKKLGIDIISNSPEVGRNLQDHIGVYLQHRCTQPITLFSLMRPDRAISAALRTLCFGSGPASAVPLEVGGFLKSQPGLNRPDIHVTFVPGLSLAATQAGQMEHGFLTNIYQLRPHSKGSIEIKTANHLDKPKIGANYLSDERDLVCIRNGFKIIRAIIKQKPMSAYRGSEIAPGDNITSENDIENWIKETADTIFHPVGTCRMGADQESVVDNKLKVRGISKLRIVDASIMPTITSGNTSIPTMMIAEKAASIILN